jgi:hypothetical protein
MKRIIYFLHYNSFKISVYSCLFVTGFLFSINWFQFPYEKAPLILVYLFWFFAGLAGGCYWTALAYEYLKDKK